MFLLEGAGGLGRTCEILSNFAGGGQEGRPRIVTYSTLFCAGVFQAFGSRDLHLEHLQGSTTSINCEKTLHVRVCWMCVIFGGRDSEAESTNAFPRLVLVVG